MRRTYQGQGFLVIGSLFVVTGVGCGADSVTATLDACTTDDCSATCPNNTRDDNEVCDGSDLAGATCEDFDFTGGNLGCASDCQSFDTSNCTGNLATAFASMPLAFAMPEGGRGNKGFFLVRDNTPIGNYESWVSHDITGDGKVDLVITAVGGAPLQDGQGAYWRVYENRGTHMASESTRWALPSGKAYTSISGRLAEGDTWTLLDIDGDSRRDLVVSGTNRVIYGQSTSPHWRIYRNVGNGFATNWEAWAVPTGGIPGRGYFSITGGAWLNLDDNAHEYETRDVTGDKLPDLIVTGRHDSSFIDADGGYWELYKNTGQGFQQTPSRFRVPDPLYWKRQSRQQVNYWTAVDIVGDSHLDLVSTSTDRYVRSDGGPHWLVYEGSDTGFVGDAMRWELPAEAAPGDRGFNQTDNRIGAGDHWYTVDMTGNGRLDLIVTKGYDAPPDRARWRLYRHTAAGVSSAPAMWPIPSTTFNRTQYTVQSTTPVHVWSHLDMNGDGQRDLVVHSYGGEIFRGADGPYWKVYLAQP